LNNIKKEDAERDLLEVKLLLEKSLDIKEKLDANSQYKRARIRLQSTSLTLK
jgi:O-succinylbenzoate synthase